MLAIAATTIFVGCKKDEKISKNLNSASTKSNLRVGPPIFASFSNLNEYDSFLNSAPNTPINQLPTGFISLKSILDEIEYQREFDTNAYYANPHLADTIYEGYGKLLELLNEDKIVNLFGNLVRIDLENDVAYSIESISTESYDLLLQNPNDNSITSYSEDDEVALILAKVTGCSEPGAQRDKDEKFGNCDSKNRTKKEVKYQKAFIYHSLVAELKNQKKIFFIWFLKSATTTGGINVSSLAFRVRCDDFTTYWSGHPSGWSPSSAYESNSKQTTFRPYSGSRALATYNFAVTIGGACGVHNMSVNNP